MKKIYDIPNLILGILGTAALLVYMLLLWEGEGYGYVVIIIAVYAMVRGFRLAFSEKDYEQKEYKRMLMKRSYQKLFGEKSRWIPFVPVVLLALSVAVALLLPEQKTLLALLLSATLIIAGWISFQYRRVMTLEKAIEDKKRMNAMITAAEKKN